MKPDARGDRHIEGVSIVSLAVCAAILLLAIVERYLS
jgi:hypothetical protein